MGAWEGSPGEMARTLPAVTARERDLREDGWSPTRRNLRGAESAAGRPGSSGNRKSEIGPESWPDLTGFLFPGAEGEQYQMQPDTALPVGNTIFLCHSTSDTRVTLS